MANPTIQGEIADAVVAYLQTPAAETAIEGAVNTGEIDLQNAVKIGLANLKVGGILGIVLPSIEAGIEAELTTILAKYTPAQIVTGLLIPWAQQEAKNLGG